MICDESNQIPDDALTQHIAIFGKTGSGKPIPKAAVEQVVANGFRVCVSTPLSPIVVELRRARREKAGVPFKILGGPHGHVPLHSSAGTESVPSSGRQVAAIDYRHGRFRAGGTAETLCRLAPALMRSMRRVLYLVIEEAHEMAPKELPGSARRTWRSIRRRRWRRRPLKGIRMIVATHGVQSWHNAVLGGCETLIAHRLTAPADKEPMLKWLKANADKETTDNVARSLPSLPTGTGWLCSARRGFSGRYGFREPRGADNAAALPGAGRPGNQGPKTAPVDQDSSANIRDAVAEAEQNDRGASARPIAGAARDAKDQARTPEVREAEQAAASAGRRPERRKPMRSSMTGSVVSRISQTR